VAPFVAWLEAGSDASELALVVVPIRALGAELAVRIAGDRPRAGELGAGGGRLALRLLRRDERVRVEVAWRHPDGVAGATARLEYPADRAEVTPARFEPILSVPVGREGATADEAIRIR
jgi:hypothetical protein